MQDQVAARVIEALRGFVEGGPSWMGELRYKGRHRAREAPENGDNFADGVALEGCDGMLPNGVGMVSVGRVDFGVTAERAPQGCRRSELTSESSEIWISAAGVQSRSR
jgi:hypothetical protein